MCEAKQLQALVQVTRATPRPHSLMASRNALGLLMAAAVLFVLHNASNASADAYGKATYYDAPYVPSACFGYDQNQFPANQYFAAASDAFYGGGSACGDYYWVWCISGCTNTNPILVRIVDHCPPGCASTIDLSTSAFQAIANLDTGIIDIGYNFAYSG